MSEFLDSAKRTGSTLFKCVFNLVMTFLFCSQDIVLKLRQPSLEETSLFRDTSVHFLPLSLTCPDS